MSYADAGCLRQRIPLWFTVYMPPAMIAGKGMARRACYGVHSRIEEQPAARPLVKPLVFDKALVVEA